MSHSSLSSLSASVCSNNSFNSIAENEISYAKLFNFPVQLNCIEMLDKTLDNYIEEKGSLSDLEWKSILFQICFGFQLHKKNIILFIMIFIQAILCLKIQI